MAATASQPLRPSLSVEARSPPARIGSGSPCPTPLQAEGAVAKLALLPVHALGYRPEQDGTTTIPAPTSPVDSHVDHKVVKLPLVVFGILSIVQFAVALALFIRPLQYNVANQYGTNGRWLSLLPAVVNVTTKTADGWLAAAVALVGVWAWERHLRKAGTSLDEMDAWGALLAGDIPGTLMNAVRLGFVPAVLFFGAVGITAAASSAVVGALTPTAGTVTVNRGFNLPSFFASDPNNIGLGCEPNVGTACRQSLGRG